MPAVEYITREPTLRCGGVLVDIECGGKRELDLTAKEFALLRYFMSHAGQVVSQEELLEHVWDEHADPFTNTVRMTVMTLRRKLGDPPVVQTVVGAGYRI